MFNILSTATSPLYNIVNGLINPFYSSKDDLNHLNHRYTNLDDFIVSESGLESIQDKSFFRKVWSMSFSLYGNIFHELLPYDSKSWIESNVKILQLILKSSNNPFNSIFECFTMNYSDTNIQNVLANINPTNNPISYSALDPITNNSYQVAPEMHITIHNVPFKRDSLTTSNYYYNKYGGLTSFVQLNTNINDPIAYGEQISFSLDQIKFNILPEYIVINCVLNLAENRPYYELAASYFRLSSLSLALNGIQSFNDYTPEDIHREFYMDQGGYKPFKYVRTSYQNISATTNRSLNQSINGIGVAYKIPISKFNLNKDMTPLSPIYSNLTGTLTFNYVVPTYDSDANYAIRDYHPSIVTCYLYNITKQHLQLKMKDGIPCGVTDNLIQHKLNLL